MYEINNIIIIIKWDYTSMGDLRGKLSTHYSEMSDGNISEESDELHEVGGEC